MVKKKFIIYIFFFLLCLTGIYLRRVDSVGYRTEQIYLNSQVQWSPTSPYEFPVHIITGNILNTKAAPETTFRLPTNLRCTTDANLCSKIKFVGDFSDADKRKYQSLIIRQIKNIDDIITTKQKLQDTLFSLTIDSSKGTRRWRAGSSTITISLGNIKTQDEFLEILTHELAHVVDLGLLQGNKRIIQNQFSNIDDTLFPANDPSLDYYRISRYNNTTRSSAATALDFVGWYAMSDPFEDFAESFNMYLNHHHVFEYLANYEKALEKKYEYMSRLFGGKYLKADIATLNEIRKTPNTRPRDSTKGY